MVISGKELSAKLKAEMAAEVATFGAKYGRVPHLVVILVGEDPGSVSYVTGKAKASAEVGIRNTTIRKPESVCEAELLGIIADLNADEGVDGILVQLPLPKHIDADKVIAAIDKEKDVDGFHPLNVAALWQKQPCTLPCTPKGILKMLRAAGVEIAGKEAVVIFGQLRTTAKLSRLVRTLKKASSGAARGVSLISAATSDQSRERQLSFSREIDVRGFRVADAIQAVTYFIDDAVQFNAGRVRILHGTGTGALRQAIRDYLDTVPAVAHYADEDIRFGGAGITVVEF